MAAFKSQFGEERLVSDWDLIVVGGGGAGLAAASTAAEAGCSVVVLESENTFGGSTCLSDGVFNAAATSVQRALGLEDSIEAYFHYYMTLNAWRQPAALIRNFCDSATETLEWLISLGLKIPPKIVHKVHGAVFPCSAATPGLYAAGVEWPPRGHIPEGGGAAYIDLLYQYAGSLGVELVPATRVQRLIVEHGSVCGVLVDGVEVRSHAVALTCGGIAHDADLLRKWFPDAFDGFEVDYLPDTIQAPGSRGDCVRLGEQAGARISGVNCGLLGTMAFFPRTEMKGFPGFQPTSLIYVNSEGRRFADETAPYAVMPGLIKAQGNMAWGIFDEAARLRSNPELSGYAQGWDPAFVEQAVAAEDIRTASTVAELAGIIGADRRNLEEAVRQYNEDLPAGVDRVFLRTLDGLHPIALPPYYAFEYRPCNVNLTGAGVTIDAGGQALDAAGVPVAGLYAAGEAGAGVLGERYVGGGNSVANALTIGRVVGKSVAASLGRL
jgi:succinate dehydrogenase/fumarate reductase flavoprotein subunit